MTVRPLLLLSFVVFALTIGVAAYATLPGAAGGPAKSPPPGVHPRDRAKSEALARSTYVPQPSASLYPVTSASVVAQNVARDPFLTSVLDGLMRPGPERDPRIRVRPTLLQPVYVRALVPGNRDQYIVPVASEGAVVGIFTVPIIRDGLGAVGSYQRSGHATFPAILEAEARALGGRPDDPVVSAELVWALVAPSEGGPADERSPFWRLVRRSGAELYLFESRELRSAGETHLRGR